jgi:membrane-bound serine protease (ClpP class)
MRVPRGLRRLTSTFRITRVFFLSLILLSLISTVVAAAPGQEVVVLTARGTINPAMAGYLARGIADAERTNAQAVVIQLDTPGGLDSSTREIMQSIINSRVPVIVYVHPPGGRAASAGLFITQAAHVAAMAPNTNIGSATPVQMGGGQQGGEGAQTDDALTRKIENDAVAIITRVAEERGRNVEWVERAVRDAVNVHDREAIELGVVDLVAPDLRSLLSSIDGRSVQLGNGQTVVLETANAPLRDKEMSVGERIIHLLSDPNLAFILMTVGVYGLIYELANPGIGVPGVAGAISLILGLYALGTMEASFAAIALILVAFALFLADVLLTPGVGVLTVVGAVTFALGSLFLFDGETPGVNLSPLVVIPVIGSTVAFFTFAVASVYRTRMLPAATGADTLVGALGVTSTEIAPEGMIHVAGELWRAVAQTPIARNQPVKIIARKGLTLEVRPVNVEQGEKPPVSRQAGDG